MYLTILILEAECIVNGTRVAMNRDITLRLLYPFPKFIKNMLSHLFPY
jgi:hypothetical protein